MSSPWKAPRQTPFGLASSPANIDRDQGVGYDSPLDPLDRVEVGRRAAPHLDRGHHAAALPASTRSASGARTYSGCGWPAVPASAAWCRAQGTCSGESSAGIVDAGQPVAVADRAVAGARRAPGGSSAASCSGAIGGQRHARRRARTPRRGGRRRRRRRRRRRCSSASSVPTPRTGDAEREAERPGGGQPDPKAGEGARARCRPRSARARPADAGAPQQVVRRRASTPLGAGRPAAGGRSPPAPRRPAAEAGRGHVGGGVKRENEQRRRAGRNRRRTARSA